MTYIVTTAILTLTVALFFVFSRKGLASFGSLQWVLRILVALPLLLSGSAHLVRTDAFASIIPPSLPYHGALVILSGVLELAGGVGLLLQRYKRAASVCLAVLMITVFPANVFAAGRTVGSIHMPGVPMRLALQAIYIVLLLVSGWGRPVIPKRPSR
jgi:uncharacterized membrane protein